MNPFNKIRNFAGKIRVSFYNIFLQQIEFNDFPTIIGEIVRVKAEKDENRKVISIRLETKFQAVNNTKGLITFINPKFLVQPKIKYFSINEREFYDFTSDFQSVPKFEFNSESGKNTDPISENQMDDLNEKIVINLKSNEKYFWDDEIFFEFELTEKKRDWQGIGWNQIRRRTSNLWLKFDYCLPENMDFIKSKLMEIEDESWENLNEIPAAQYFYEDFKTNIDKLVTQTILFDLSKVEVVD